MIITGSSKISTLDFAAVYDISLATPQIRITNRSTGPNLAGCTWWFIVTTPSTSELHEGSLATPDITGAWAGWTMPDEWLQRFYHVEWSGEPYTITLWVSDGTTTYSLAYSCEICPPSGNSGQVRNNFGVATIDSATVKCDTGQVMLHDASDYTYKGKQGAIISLDWNLVYPSLSDGSSLPTTPLSGTSYAYFPVVYNGKGYIGVLNTVVEYVIDANNSIRVKYKGQISFDVSCNIDLCGIVCGYEKLLEKVEKGGCADADMRNKLTLMNAKVNLAIVASTSECTGIDLAKLVAEIKQELGDCDCGCPDDGGINPQG